MVADTGTDVTEAQWSVARSQTRRNTVLTAFAAIGLFALGTFPAAYVGNTVSSGTIGYLVTVATMAFITAPLVFAMTRQNLHRQEATDAVVATMAQQLTDSAKAAGRLAEQRELQAKGQKFERRLVNALEMADVEPEVVDVIERAFASTLPDSPAELLLADNSHAHLIRMASSAPTGEPPGCPVDSPDRCPAARRAQIQRFDDSDALDACPKLRDRTAGRISALCVPVSIMGRTVGVIHATGAPGQAFAEDQVAEIGTLANLTGARIGLLRVMAETQLQAATDSLTGLLNRRSFEQHFTAARAESTRTSVAIADLDHFKELNDTYGHETGDRALRLFAQVLRDSVRAQDVTGRHGGEEFVIALTNCGAAQARQVLDALRSRLDAAVTVAGLPKFTVSIGVVEASDHEGVPTLVERADQALFRAKREGRDRVIVHDVAGEPLPLETVPGSARELAGRRETPKPSTRPRHTDEGIG